MLDWARKCLPTSPVRHQPVTNIVTTRAPPMPPRRRRRGGGENSNALSMIPTTIPVVSGRAENVRKQCSHARVCLSLTEADPVSPAGSIIHDRFKDIAPTNVQPGGTRSNKDKVTGSTQLVLAQERGDQRERRAHHQTRYKTPRTRNENAGDLPKALPSEHGKGKTKLKRSCKRGK